jgi:uncharacterized membrane protein (DUF2068 family)
MIDHPIPGEPGHRSVSFVCGTDPTHKKGLRTVAIVEFCKGLAGIGIAAGFLILRNKDLWDIVESAMEFLHINPDRHFAQVILDYADRVTPAQLLSLALLAFAYSCLRFLEAYGLWKTRVWGEWLAIFSGLVYLPFEARAVLHHSTALHWSVIAVNLGLVAYVAYVRISGIRSARQQRSSREGAEQREQTYVRQTR